MTGRSVIPCLLAFTLCAGVAAQDVDHDLPAAGLFSGHEVLELSLAADFDSLCRPNEDEDCEYTPTILVAKAADGSDRGIPVEIRVRGGWRARKDHCEVPPLFVRFPGEGAAATPFAGQGLLPLTTHCKNRISRGFNGGSGADYQQYVLSEYLGYRLYNEVTDRSLRVRLARVTYTNPVKPGKPLIRYAFFTEHFDDMAGRLGLQRLPEGSFDHTKIDLFSLDQVSLFNFMIGNTDSSVPRERNILLLAGAEGRQYPVPYDLDMSGLVDAEYGGVSPRLDFRDPQQRYYLGFCHPAADFEKLFAEFRQASGDMVDMVAGTPGISRKNRKESRRYLEKFFRILDSDRQRRQDIIEACHPWPPSPVDHTTPPDPQ